MDEEQEALLVINSPGFKTFFKVSQDFWLNKLEMARAKKVLKKAGDD